METPRLPVPRADRTVPAHRSRAGLPVSAVRAAAVGGLAWTALWLLRPAAAQVLRRLMRPPSRPAARVRRVTVVTWVEFWRD